MSTPTLYTIPMQAKGKYIRAVAALTGVAYQLPAAYEHYKTNKESEFLAKFPFGKIPAWEDGDFRLFEADAIARYLASKSPSTGLLGSSPEDAALIDQWTHLVESEIDVPTSLVRTLCAGTIPYSKPAHTYATDRILRALKVLDTHLATHTFLVGERLTLADLIVAGLIQHSTKFTIDAAVRKAYPHTIRHLETVVNQPKLAEIYGPLEYVEKGIQFVPAKKDDKKKEAKPEKKKEDKPKAKPKVVEKDDDEDEPLVPEEPKKKNPLDDLPKSTFNLEDWKRAYSNMETRGSGGALEWFYKNYDPTGFSVWRVDFKYPTELTQIFMSSNQIGGFFNRLEASRKYLFASVGVLGEANNSAISGALILRGQEALPVVDVAPDWESYEYVKLDLEKEGDKSFFEAAMAWDLEVDGKKWADGKNFK